MPLNLSELCNKYRTLPNNFSDTVCVVCHVDALQTSVRSKPLVGKPPAGPENERHQAVCNVHCSINRHTMTTRVLYRSLALQCTAAACTAAASRPWLRWRRRRRIQAIERPPALPIGHPDAERPQHVQRQQARPHSRQLQSTVAVIASVLVKVDW